LSSVQQNFIEYLSGLAMQGETSLIVRQKPQLKNGEMQFHANGAIKATWPAYLPTHKIKPDWAIYGNTASFIIDRFTDGHPSASVNNAEYVMVMVLDDVGDPDKAPNIPPLQPTWKMETSAGSFQWGYTFSDQPTTGEFTAAIKAIAAAGYTDPGATNAVRNFRLPESINLKPGRDNFASVLTEFDPKIEYTLEEICKAFNVTPDAADTATIRAVRLLDDGNDDVVRWLSVNSLILTKPNSQGWMGIVCPNYEQHTDGNPEGRYLPLSRAFCCLHSHCIDFDSTSFLAWVEAQGGPKHSPGLRDELLASSMNAALSKLTPTEAFPDRGAEIIAEVERKEVGRVEKAGWFDRFAYVTEDDAYFDLQEREEISRGSFNALFRHIDCKSIHNIKRRVEASVSFDENRQTKGAPALTGITFAAGEGVLVARGGRVFGNRWRNLRPPVQAGNVKPWLDHCARLVPNNEEREHIFNVMAYKLQHPNAKINHAILHGGHQGSGKDSMWAPFFWGIRGDSKDNVKLMSAQQLNSQFQYQLETEVLVLNELREPDAKERRALANALKPIIAAPPDLISINRKGLKPYEMLNRIFVMAFSNDQVSITLDSDDRRWFCVWSTAAKMTEEESARLWAWYNRGGLSASAAWLYARDVSAFNPSATPMLTDYKRSMIEQGMSGAESFLYDQLLERKGEFSRGVIAAPFQALCARLSNTGVKIPPPALVHALAEAKWVDCGRVMTRDYTTKKQIYAAPEMAKKYSKAELRRMVEEMPATSPPLQIVK
jgi:hypothetical protein